MLDFDDISVNGITARSLAVSWSFRPALDLVANYRVDISRSLSPESGFVVIANGIRADQFVYVDQDPPELSKWATLYYKVRAYQVDSAGTEIPNTETTSTAERMNQEVSAYGMAIVRARELHFKHLGIGRDSLVYRRRTSGQVCPQCWDPVEERVKRHDCPLCYGTGKIGGYYPPLRVLIQYRPAKRSNMVEGSIREIIYIDAAMGHYPLVSPRDVIYEVGTGNWYLVNQISVREHLRTVLMQQLVLRLLDPQSKEQDLIGLPQQVTADLHTSHLITAT